MTPAEADVLAERARQREQWGDAHDDGHIDGALADAASLLCNTGWTGVDDEPSELPAGPGGAFQLRYRHDRRRQLVIGAAFAIAEIDRLDRAAAREKP